MWRRVMRNTQTITKNDLPFNRLDTIGDKFVVRNKTLTERRISAKDIVRCARSASRGTTNRYSVVRTRTGVAVRFDQS